VCCCGTFQEWVTKPLAKAELNFDFFVKKMGCSADSPAAVRQCLVAAPVMKIINMSTDFTYPDEVSVDQASASACAPLNFKKQCAGCRWR
jgi:hypothetical protein